tara:strand:+ start:2408 stop:3103 length:696 start_codon:yes stop_codon:yes gene_type:complete
MKIKDTKKYSCVGEYHSGGGCLHSLVGTSNSERFWLINPIDRFSGEPILEYVTDDSQVCMFGFNVTDRGTYPFFIAPFKIGLAFILELNNNWLEILESTYEHLRSENKTTSLFDDDFIQKALYRSFYRWLLASTLDRSLSDQEFTTEEIQACFTDAPREFNPHYQWIACTFGEGYEEQPPKLKLLSELLIDEDGEWNIEQHDWFKLLLLEPSKTHTVHSVTFENSFTKLPH